MSRSNSNIVSGNLVLSVILCCALFFQGIFALNNALNYGEALRKSLLFYEAQRSGKLPHNQRVLWRGDSALNDGHASHIDLVGGYYDAGDNLKLGFPMAFTITMLSWSTLEFKNHLKARNELINALNAIKWGTDYLIKAHPQPNVLCGEIGGFDSDHECWERPEDMTTPRTVFRIDDQHPGSDLAAETAAALAAASITFRRANPRYSTLLLSHAEQLFDFALKHPGLYQNSIPDSGKAYSSSGYEDEMLWAAIWLHRATNNKTYLDFLKNTKNTGGTRTTFSWDDKFVGAQVLVAKLVLEGKISGDSGVWNKYKDQAEDFICSCIQKASNNVKKTPGGLLWFLPWNNVQYVATATFVTAVYSNYLIANKHTSIDCPAGPVKPHDLLTSVRSQVNYILGVNPKNMSYMVGFGTSFPKQIHHRAASIVSIKKDPTPVTCKGGYEIWFNRNESNPNVLDGAMVSADENDSYTDARSNYQTAEPTTVTNAPLVGVFALFALLK